MKFFEPIKNKINGPISQFTEKELLQPLIAKVKNPKYTAIDEQSISNIQTTTNITDQIKDFKNYIKRNQVNYQWELEQLLIDYLKENPSKTRLERALSILTKIPNYSLMSLIVLSMILIKINHGFTRKYLKCFFPESFQHNSKLSKAFSFFPDQLKHGKLEGLLYEQFNEMLEGIAGDYQQTKSGGEKPTEKEKKDYAMRNFAILHERYQKEIYNPSSDIDFVYRGPQKRGL